MARRCCSSSKSENRIWKPLKAGLPNLRAHIKNLQEFRPTGSRISLNHFFGDPEDEIEVVRNECKALGAKFAVSDGFAKGGEGAVDVAKELVKQLKKVHNLSSFLTTLTRQFLKRFRKLIQKVYGGKDVEFSPAAQKTWPRLTLWASANFLSAFSFSSREPGWRGAPKDFPLPVQRLILNAGAGFIVVTTGAIMRMPGLPEKTGSLLY